MNHENPHAVFLLITACSGVGWCKVKCIRGSFFATSEESLVAGQTREDGQQQMDRVLTSIIPNCFKLISLSTLTAGDSCRNVLKMSDRPEIDTVLRTAFGCSPFHSPRGSSSANKWNTYPTNYPLQVLIPRERQRYWSIMCCYYNVFFFYINSANSQECEESFWCSTVLYLIQKQIGRWF